MDLNSFKNKIPLPIRLFLGKALLFYIAWELLYGFFLAPGEVLDIPLTTHVGEASAWFLNGLGQMGTFAAEPEIYAEVLKAGAQPKDQLAMTIYHDSNEVLYIAHACNGLLLMVLFIGFVVCMPSPFWRKVLYIILGVIILDIVNILRCAALIYMSEYFNAYFDFAHHYLFKATIYSATFLIWMRFARKIQFKNEALPI